MIFNAVKRTGGFHTTSICSVASIKIIMKKTGIMSHGKNRTSAFEDLLEELFMVSVIKTHPYHSMLYLLGFNKFLSFLQKSDLN